MQNQNRFLKINTRILIFFMIWLLCFDIGIGLAEKSYLSSEVRRLPADDRGTFLLWKRHLTENKGFRVVFIGDSVVHGGGVPEEKETLPSLFQKEMMRQGVKVSVFNFSLPGVTPADAYVISLFLRDAHPDLVIYDGNIGWFGNKKVMEHPGLLSLIGDSVPAQLKGRVQAPESKSGREDRIADAVSSVWKLYRDRIFLNYWWFGEPYRDKVNAAVKQDSLYYLLPHAEEGAPDKKELYRPWYEKNFASLQASRFMLGRVVLSEDNPQWVCYQEMLSLWKREGVPVAVFMVPRNNELLDRYQVKNPQSFRKHQRMLAEAARSRGALVFDYTEGVVKDRHFVDTVHPDADGNRELSVRLAQDLLKSGLAIKSMKDGD